MKAAVVLSGGGAAGIRHVARLEILSSLGVEICGISGVSAGALCASGFVWGGGINGGANSLKDMFSSIKSEADVFRSRYWVELPFSNGSKSAGPLKKKVQGLFDKRIPCAIPFRIGVTDLVAKDIEFFSGNHPDIVNLVVASASIPVVVDPYVIEGGKKVYVDGGVMENCPLREAEKFRPEIVFVSHCFPRLKRNVDKTYRPNGLKNMLLRTLDAMTTESYREDLEICPNEINVPIVHLEPSTASIDTMDFTQEKIWNAFNETLRESRPLICDAIAKHR